MSNKRIDLTQFENYNAWDFYQDKILETEPNLGIMMLALIAELKRCYALLDKIAEQAIPDNEDPELYGYVIDYELIKAITKSSEEE